MLRYSPRLGGFIPSSSIFTKLIFVQIFISVDVIRAVDPGTIDDVLPEHQEAVVVLQQELALQSVQQLPSAFQPPISSLLVMPPLPQQVGMQSQQPEVRIVEQPASKALRFRYECEGRSAGSIPGANSTPENKTFPTINVVGYKGRAVVVVSCVTKDEPFK